MHSFIIVRQECYFTINRYSETNDLFNFKSVLFSLLFVCVLLLDSLLYSFSASQSILLNSITPKNYRNRLKYWFLANYFTFISVLKTIKKPL